MTDSSEPTSPEEAPFEGLRLPATPLAPRPGFSAELRRLMEAALRPNDPDPTRALEARTMSSTENTVTTATDTDAPSPLVPYLAVAGAAEAIDWYRDVLGAIEVMRFVGDDGKVGHAEIVIGDAHCYLADEFPEIDVIGPVARGGTSVTLHLQVVDVDDTYGRAEGAGAAGLRPPGDQGHGNRTATIIDPFGHRWMLSQPIDAARTATAEAETGAGGNGQDWTVTARRPIEPGYLVMHTTDLDRAQAFFGQLFDWEFEVGGAGGGHVANTRFPLGLAPPGDDGADRLGSPSSTTVYFRVDEIEHYATRVVELGGHVLARSAYDSGASAECVDDQGYRFDLWKPAPGY